MITALEVDIPHHLVISSSTDKTIRLWCLETFKQTYVLETGEEVHHMGLMTSRRLFYQSHEHIRVWNLNHFHTLFTMLGFEIVTSRRVVSRGFPTRLLLHGKDGAIRIVSPSDGTIITTMFPLDTLSEGIVDYAYNPREDKLYVVLSSGAILVFSTRTNPCRLVCKRLKWLNVGLNETIINDQNFLVMSGNNNDWLYGDVTELCTTADKRHGYETPFSYRKNNFGLN